MEGGNYTFNCTLMIPKLSQCSEGQTYTYEPNSVSFLISYKNGNQKTEAQTITATLPAITTKQGIRTLYDITQEGIRKMKEKLANTMQIAREMLDAYKSCMETVKLLSYLTLFATIGAGLYGGYRSLDKNNALTGTITGKTTTDKWTNKDTKDLMNTVSGLGSSMITAWTNYCNMISKTYQLDLEIQQVEMNMVQAEMCMEQQQHMLDIGKCDGREESCFSSMVSCVNSASSAIKSSISDMNSIMSSASSDATKMATALGKIGDALGTFGVGGTAIFAVYCNDDARDTCCTTYNIGTGITDVNKITNCGQSTMRMSIEKINCPFPVVYKDGTLLCSPTTTDCNNRIIELKGTTASYTSKFKLYCFDSQYASAVSSNSIGNYEATDVGKTIQILVDTTGGCGGTTGAGGNNLQSLSESRCGVEKGGNVKVVLIEGGNFLDDNLNAISNCYISNNQGEFAGLFSINPNPYLDAQIVDGPKKVNGINFWKVNLVTNGNCKGGWYPELLPDGCIIYPPNQGIAPASYTFSNTRTYSSSENYKCTNGGYCCYRTYKDQDKVGCKQNNGGCGDMGLADCVNYCCSAGYGGAVCDEDYSKGVLPMVCP